MEVRAQRSFWAEFGIAVATVGTAFLVRMFLLDGAMEQDAPMLYFVLPVIISGWLGGFRSGLMATVLSTGLGMYYFLAPVGSLAVQGLSQQLRVPTFIAGGALISWGAGAMHQARQRAQSAAASLRIQDEAWRRILISIGDAVIAADVRRRVMFLNNQAELLTGWRASDALGRSLDEVYRTTSEPAGSAESGTANNCRAGERHGISTLLTRDGRTLAIDEVIAPICDESDPAGIGMVVVFRDVTQRRAAEADLRTSDRRKGEFLATLSHELRNPVGAIKSALQLLRMSGEGESSVESIHERMDRQLEILIRLIDDLQDVSRIERGKLTIKREIVSLPEILRSALDATEGQVQQYNHQLTLEEADEPLLLDADPQRLAQVIINLINNAARYTPRGGHIWVTCLREGDEAVVRVQDNGIGIARDDLPHIFELFGQAEPTSPEAEQGLGIGLALVQRIVTLHGGRVQAQSDGPGRGSQFTVWLPIAAEHPHENAPLSSPRPAGRRKSGKACRVLLVEDSLDNAQLLSELLRLMGHEVDIALDARTVLSKARAFAPQVILSDITMPHLDGYELAARLRADPQLSAVYLVAVTGHCSDEDRDRSFAAGFDEHLAKPVDINHLQRMLMRVAGRETSEQSSSR